MKKVTLKPRQLWFIVYPDGTPTDCCAASMGLCKDKWRNEMEGAAIGSGNSSEFFRKYYNSKGWSCRRLRVS